MPLPAILGALGRAALGAAATKGGSSALGDVGALLLNQKEKIAELVGDVQKLTQPITAHAITVSVSGGPTADLRRCWYLALAACFGRYKRGLKGTTARTINAQWDVTGKTVSITLAYTFGTGGVEIAAGYFNGDTGIRLLYAGPDQVTIGDGWPSWLSGFDSTGALQTSTSNFAGGGLPSGAVGAVTLPLAAAESTQQQQNTPVPDAFADLGAATITNPVLRGVLVEYKRLTSDFALIYPGLPVRGTVPSQSFTELPDVLRELPSVMSGMVFLPYRHNGTTANQPRTRFAASVAGAQPLLPDAGRIITTGETNDRRVQPPRPPIDGTSRGHVLSIIGAALATPGFLPVAPPISGVPVASEGLYVDSPRRSAWLPSWLPSWLYPGSDATRGARERSNTPANQLLQAVGAQVNTPAVPPDAYEPRS